jgi:HK97 gp10 family phage protein
MIKFKIIGLEEVKKALRELPRSINERIQLDVNRKAGLIVKKEMQETAPEGNNTKKSRNKASQNILIKRSKSKSGIFVGISRAIFYMAFRELGTKVRSLLGRGKYRKGTNRGRMTPKKWIEPAHRSALPKVVDFMNKNYLKIINNSLKKQLRRFK